MEVFRYLLEMAMYSIVVLPGVYIFLLLFESITEYHTFFQGATYHRIGAMEDAVKVTAPFNWGSEYYCCGQSALIPRFFNPFWWRTNQRHCRFKVSNFSDVKIGVNWVPAGGNADSSHFGNVIVPPHSSKKVTVLVRRHGVIFDPYPRVEIVRPEVSAPNSPHAIVWDGIEK